MCSTRRTVRLLAVVGSAWMLGPRTTAAAPPLGSLLPEAVQGWRRAEPDGIYTADTLFELIDGSAEVYRSFNVRAVVSRRFAKAGSADILADVFDMGSAADAFGAFHHDIQDGTPAGVGRESELSGSTLRFWKDRYFVSVVAFEETPELTQAVRLLGHRIATRIEGDGAGPSILSLLPRAGLDARQITYFHDDEYLGTRHAFGVPDPLGLDRATEGLLTRYRTPGTGAAGQGSVAIVVRYPTLERVRAGEARFVGTYLAEARRDGDAWSRRGRWVAIARWGRLLVTVLDAPSRQEARRLLEAFRKLQSRTGHGG